jgi:hypothetical protein
MSQVYTSVITLDITDNYLQLLQATILTMDSFSFQLRGNQLLELISCQSIYLTLLIQTLVVRRLDISST